MRDSDSGGTVSTEIPDEIKKWNWGAFILSWIWGVGNGVYISLVTPILWLATKIFFDNLILKSIAGISALALQVILGMKGSEWAWRNGKWKDIETFKRVQKKWFIGAMFFCAIGVLLWICMKLLGALAAF